MTPTRGPERELVYDRDRDYMLNGSETRTLANSCSEAPEPVLHADDFEAPSTPSKSLPLVFRFGESAFAEATADNLRLACQP
jgi:hypothetical protein